MTTVVAATTRRDEGTRPSRRIRSQGQVPGVVYGLGQEPVSVSVSYVELREALKGTEGWNAVFNLSIDGESTRVIVKDYQRDPIRRTVAHVDLLRVADDVPVRITLPVRVVGTAAKVLDTGGMVEQKVFRMRVEVRPDRIPTAIEVDVTNLTPTQRITVGDIRLPDGVRALINDRDTVVAPVVTRAARMLAMQAEAEAAAEAAAAAESE